MRDPWRRRRSRSPDRGAACRCEWYRPTRVARSGRLPHLATTRRASTAFRRLNPLEPFIADALRRQLRQTLRVRLRRLEGASVNPKLEARAESKRAQNPQIVLLEPPIGVADRADQLLGEVLLPLKRVPPLVPDRMIRDGVDRKVAPREVIHQGHAKLHH